MQIKEALINALEMLNPKPAYITFSGNGEATLHPRFPDLVADLLDIRGQYSNISKTAILSNSTGLADLNIRDAVNCLDEKIMKLDTGTEEMLKRYNRPVIKTSLAGIVENLKQIPGVTIQSLFSNGKAGNTHPDHIQAWLDKIIDIQPKKVQIYTLDRGYPSRNISPASQSMLLEIKARLDAAAINCEVY
jgi:wyosine [tRNA(Phe)-imidazoG37] synthetase (radical SAM superfamily)